MLSDHPAVRGALFYPRGDDSTPTRFVEVGGASIACFEFSRHPNAGTLIHFHGNGELASEYAGHYADFFLDMGVNVCFVEYRGYGRSTGTPSLTGMMGDGAAVLAALGLPADRVVAFGRSMGSVYAVELASRLPLAGLVVESGLAGPTARWESLPAAGAAGVNTSELASELRHALDPKRKLATYHGPMLVLHAAGDTLVPPDHAERLHAASGSADKRLVVFPYGNHNTILRANLEDYVRELRDFFLRSGVAGNPAN